MKNHYDIVLKKLEGWGKKPTPEQLTELAALQSEINRLYQLIVLNTTLFGEVLLQIKENDDTLSLKIIESDEDLY